ncbi:hypothetical protein CF15_01340 [Pyrodictium occultum]|uniref:NAD kinase n=1 Tax=Pyrodictium occultum TaxID=2309 RepID=A0A0V8RU92_PYROC|nr:NAD(+)/NADH kinase [Pyrodictium occultum]KSW11514.1 hypothetical protein CF15_01340 [Pyrodictium occultum]
MPRRVAIYARPDRVEALELAREAYRRLLKLGAEPAYDISIAGPLGGPGVDLRFDDVEGVVVIGGDGTLLRLLQLLGARNPVLHLVRLGRRAFLFDEGPRASMERLADFVEGRFRVEEHPRLIVRARGGVSYALNEAAVLALGSKVAGLRVELGGETAYEDLEGDGLIIATPTGSTAYCYSAGGPVLHPGLDAVAVVPVNPLDRRIGSIVAPGGEPVRLVVERTTRPVKLIIDGVRESLLARGAVIEAVLRGPPARIARYRGGGKLRLPWRRPTC